MIMHPRHKHSCMLKRATEGRFGSERAGEIAEALRRRKALALREIVAALEGEAKRLHGIEARPRLGADAQRQGESG